MDASNPHVLVKGDVGLGSVDNTSDADKPVSTAQQTALDDKVDKVIGKVLSANDYTDLEKTKLGAIETAATKTYLSDVLFSYVNAGSTNVAANVLASLLADYEQLHVTVKYVMNGNQTSNYLLPQVTQIIRKADLSLVTYEHPITTYAWLSSTEGYWIDNGTPGGAYDVPYGTPLPAQATDGTAGRVADGIGNYTYYVMNVGAGTENFYYKTYASIYLENNAAVGTVPIATDFDESVTLGKTTLYKYSGTDYRVNVMGVNSAAYEVKIEIRGIKL
jgi:hypothetical protein